MHIMLWAGLVYAMHSFGSNVHQGIKPKQPHGENLGARGTWLSVEVNFQSQAILALAPFFIFPPTQTHGAANLRPVGP